LKNQLSAHDFIIMEFYDSTFDSLKNDVKNLKCRIRNKIKEIDTLIFLEENIMFEKIIKLDYYKEIIDDYIYQLEKINETYKKFYDLLKRKTKSKEYVKNGVEICKYNLEILINDHNIIIKKLKILEKRMEIYFNY